MFPSQLARKQDIYEKRLRRLYAAVKANESATHIFKAAEMRRFAQFSLFKAKRSVIDEPPYDPDGSQSRCGRRGPDAEEEGWTSLSTEEIVEKYGK